MQPCSCCCSSLLPHWLFTWNNTIWLSKHEHRRMGHEYSSLWTLFLS